MKLRQGQKVSDVAQVIEGALEAIAEVDGQAERRERFNALMDKHDIETVLRRELWMLVRLKREEAGKDE